jgi:hypothetical protein
MYGNPGNLAKICRHPILPRDYITAYFGCCTSPSPTIFDEVRNFL